MPRSAAARRWSWAAVGWASASARCSTFLVWAQVGARPCCLFGPQSPEACTPRPTHSEMVTSPFGSAVEGSPAGWDSPAVPLPPPLVPAVTDYVVRHQASFNVAIPKLGDEPRRHFCPNASPSMHAMPWPWHMCLGSAPQPAAAESGWRIPTCSPLMRALPRAMPTPAGPRCRGEDGCGRPGPHTLRAGSSCFAARDCTWLGDARACKESHVRHMLEAFPCWTRQGSNHCPGAAAWQAAMCCFRAGMVLWTALQRWQRRSCFSRASFSCRE